MSESPPDLNFGRDTWPASDWLRTVEFIDNAPASEERAPIHATAFGRINGQSGGPALGRHFPVRVVSDVRTATILIVAVLTDDIRWKHRSEADGDTADDGARDPYPVAIGDLRVLVPRACPGDENDWKVLDDMWTEAHLYVESVSFVAKEHP